MACPCSNKITTELVCNSCERHMDLRHNPGKDPLKWVIQLNRVCTKCGSKDWRLA